MDSSVQYVGHHYCITGPSNNANPAENMLKSWVDHISLSYDMILLL